MVDNKRSCKREDLVAVLFSVLRRLHFLQSIFLFISDPGSSFISRAMMKEAELDYILLQSRRFGTLEVYDIEQYERQGNVHECLVNVICNIRVGEWGYDVK